MIENRDQLLIKLIGLDEWLNMRISIFKEALEVSLEYDAEQIIKKQNFWYYYNILGIMFRDNEDNIKEILRDDWNKYILGVDPYDDKAMAFGYAMITMKDKSSDIIRYIE